MSVRRIHPKWTKLFSSVPNVIGTGGKYVTLPQYDLSSAGTVLESFEVAADFTPGGTGTITDNTTAGEFRTGTESVKFTTDVAGIQSGTKTINWVTGDSAPNRLRVYFYCHNAAPTDYVYIRVHVSNSTNIAANYFRASKVNPDLQPGWNVWDIYPEDWSSGGTVAWGTMVRMRLYVAAAATKVAAVSWDRIDINPVMQPAVMMCFDDAYSSVYTQAYAYMHSKGINGTFNVISSLIDGVGNVTSTQLQEMSVGGWSIANHSSDANALTGLTQAQVTAKLVACKNALDALGLTDASAHASYPNASFDETVRLGAIDAGIITGRRGTGYPPCIADQNLFWPSADELDSGLTLAAAQTLVDTAYTTGRILALYGHQLQAAAGVGIWAIADFQALIDYIQAKEMPFLTVEDYYALQSGPVTIAL